MFYIYTLVTSKCIFEELREFIGNSIYGPRPLKMDTLDANFFPIVLFYLPIATMKSIIHFYELEITNTLQIITN